jgi:peptidoglycan/LPS O-acetylase OafA/YrhL
MLLLLRLLSILVGAATAWRVLDGQMTQPLFKVADLAVGAALVIAALMPKGVAPTALVAASAYALGVFSIALAGYLVPGHPADPLLMAAMAVNLTTILLLFPRGGHH